MSVQLVSNATQIVVNAAIDTIENELEEARKTPAWAAATLIIVAILLAVMLMQFAACVIAMPFMMALSRWRKIQEADSMAPSVSAPSEMQFPDAEEPRAIAAPKSSRSKRHSSKGFKEEDDMEF